MSIVEQATKATAKRITYGIEIRVGEFTLNEWGLHESQAKEVNEMLVLNGDRPVTVETDDGSITFSRRAPSSLSSKLAAMKADLAKG
jgi:hypothetical protein